MKAQETDDILQYVKDAVVTKARAKELFEQEMSVEDKEIVVTFVRHDDTTSAINKDALSAYKFNKLLLI
jgi:hypothetical protein